MPSRMFLIISRPNRTEPMIQPTSATPKRNGSVYNEAAVHHAPAINTSTGTSSTTQVNKREAGCPLISDDRIVGCHVANQLNGAVRRSTAPCHCAGNNCASESNIVLTSQEEADAPRPTPRT